MLAFCTVAYSRICGLFAKKSIWIYMEVTLYMYGFSKYCVFLMQLVKRTTSCQEGKKKRSWLLHRLLIRFISLWKKVLLIDLIGKSNINCVKSVCIRSYFSPCFPAFRLTTEIYSLSLHIQSECGEIRTRITPSTDTFYRLIALLLAVNQVISCHCFPSVPLRNIGKSERFLGFQEV